MAHAMEHCQRPWWKRPPFWFVGIALAVLIAVVAVEQTGRQPPMPYSAFLDQLEAGNIAQVAFNETEITARTTKGDSLRSRVPDVGDPGLIAALRAKRVAIEVTAPSAWSWLLGRVPWPMLIFVGAMLVLGFIRLVRGGAAHPGSGTPALPAHGMMGLVSGLFAKQPPAETPPAPGSGGPKNH